MADGADPGLPSNPEIELSKDTSAEVNRERVKFERLSRLTEPQRIERARNTEEVLALVNRGWEEESRSRIEKKHGAGYWGAFKATVEGDLDVEINEAGEVTNSVIGRVREAGRRFVRTFVNKKTILGGIGLAAVGYMTAGTGLPALYAYLGGIAGRGVGESYSFLAGTERTARTELVKAEYDQWYDMKRLAAEYNAARDVDIQTDLLQQLTDKKYGVSKDALSRYRDEKEQGLVGAMQKEKKLHDGLQLVGYGAGLGAGLMAAKAAVATGTARGGYEAFGGVDTDLNGKLHYVSQQNEQWNFLYESAKEANDAAKVGNTVIPNIGWAGAHVLNKSNSGVGAYAYAAAKSLFVLGGFGLGAAAPSPMKFGAEKYQQDLEKQRKERKSEHERVAEAFGRVRPALGIPPTETEAEEQRRELNSADMRAFVEQAPLNQLKLVPKAGPAELQIVVDKNGAPLLGPGESLDPKAAYKAVAIDQARNWIRLRDEQTGKSVYADLLKFRNIVLPFPEPKPKDAEKGAIVPVVEKKIEATVDAEPTESWDDMLRTLADRDQIVERRGGKLALDANSVWVVRAGREFSGTVINGDDKGRSIELRPGRYRLKRTDPKSKLVRLVSVDNRTMGTIEVEMADFADRIESINYRIESIFDDREAAGIPVPPSKRIARDQEYDYQHQEGPAAGRDAAVVVYRVTQLSDDSVEIDPGPAGTKKTISKLLLADRAVYRS